jgi:hypothetical protein
MRRPPAEELPALARPARPGSMFTRAPRCQRCDARHGANASITLDPTMSDELLLFGAAAAVRLLLSTVFPALPDLLGGRVEVSTPVTSFKRCTHYQCMWKNKCILTTLQYRKVSFYTPTMSLRTMAAYTTKHPSFCHSSRFSPVPPTTPSLRTCFISW